MTQPPNPSARRPAVDRIVEIVKTIALTLVIFVGVQAFIAQPYKVQQGSMETTLLPDQYVLVDKLTPHWSSYTRGDIVVFDPPATFRAGNGLPFIKRVIGLPGDTVELRDGIVFVNGTALDEPYIFEDNGVPQLTQPAPGGTSTWLVPDRELLVFGDHRGGSQDSRVFGPIEISRVIGRAWLRYWPAGTFGTLSTPAYPGVSPAP
jgi:signal peptidase I